MWVPHGQVSSRWPPTAPLPPWVVVKMKDDCVADRHWASTGCQGCRNDENKTLPILSVQSRVALGWVS